MLIVQSIRFVLLFLFLSLATSGYAAKEQNKLSYKSSIIMQLEIKAVTGPTTSDYIEHSLQKAIDNQVRAVLTHMDTQDGLDLSMRQYITTIIASPVPVISYVAPTGVGELKFPRLKSNI